MGGESDAQVRTQARPRIRNSKGTMNTQIILNRLTAHQGIEAVLLRGTYQGGSSQSSNEVSAPVLEGAHTISELVHGDVRAVVGRHTILAQYEEGATLVVAIPTGHPVAKSLRRMIRRAKTSKRGL